jgi:predicted HicB family RNase H-like nuclease
MEETKEELTTIAVSKRISRRAKIAATQQGVTLKEFVEDALELALKEVEMPIPKHFLPGANNKP